MPGDIMFLRCHSRKKNGKLHRYWSVVESRRTRDGSAAQRQVLYLGEINDSQQVAWRKSIEVFDEDAGRHQQVSLFPDDRPIPADEANALALKITEMRLRRARRFGDCWLGCLLWDELGLGGFWQSKLADQRGDVPWAKVVQLLAINRLCDPGSEWALHRRWFLDSAMDELLEVDFAAAEKDRLYRCLDRLLAHKDALCQHLVQRWKTLFDARFDILLYDLTSTYFEGQCRQNPKARFGYSRDQRSDCRQVVIALVVTTDGLPLAYEVMAGNTADKTTLKGFLSKVQDLYGKARRVWVMDRGIPTEAVLKQMRQEQVAYLVGTPRHLLSKMEQSLADKPWEQVHEGMSVKLLKQADELYVMARSGDRQKKEAAMRRRKLQALVKGLNRLKRRRRLKRDTLLRRVAVLRRSAGPVAKCVKVREPAADEPVNRHTFVCRLDLEAWKQMKQRDGCYILRGFVPWEDFPEEMEKSAPVLWSWYMQLVGVEEAFRTLKSDLGLRPVHHQLEHRVEAHVLVAFLGYCLTVSLRMRLKRLAPGLTPRQVLASLSAIQMVEVQVPTTDGRTLVLPRHTEPEAQQQLLLETLKLELPPQPPPRIRSGQIDLPASRSA
jgi:transposase